MLYIVIYIFFILFLYTVLGIYINAVNDDIWNISYTGCFYDSGQF